MKSHKMKPKEFDILLYSLVKFYCTQSGLNCIKKIKKNNKKKEVLSSKCRDTYKSAKRCLWFWTCFAIMNMMIMNEI